MQQQNYIQSVNMNRFQILCLLVVATRVKGKLEIVMDGEYEDCGSQYFDMSELEFVTYNDTHIFLDGNVTFCIWSTLMNKIFII